MERKFTDSLIQFDTIYEQYHKAVYKNIFKYIKDEQVADDIFQDVFMSLWECLRMGKEINSFPSWLYVVSHNKSISYLKKTVKTSKVIASQEINEHLHLLTQVDDQLIHETTEEQLQQLYRAVDQLPKQKRTVFCMNKFEGKDVEEIARLLEISPLSVREYLKQSTRTIKSLLNQNPELIQNTVVAGLVAFYIQL